MVVEFYSLFLALAPVANRSARLVVAERAALRKELDLFRRDVDQAKRKDNKAQFDSDVHEYAEAVTRAATDLGRRAARSRILEARVRKALATVERQRKSA
jgi:hypothetical protein